MRVLFVIVICVLITTVGFIPGINSTRKVKGEENNSATEIGPFVGDEIDQNGDNTYVTHISDDKGLFLSKSEDGGDTWETKNLVESNNVSYTADVAVNGEYIHILYVTDHEQTTREISDLFYLKSEDGGETWGEPIKLTKRDRFRYSGPTIVIEDDILYVMGYRFGNHSDERIYLIKSEDQGENWSDFSYPVKDLDIVDWPPVSFSVEDSKIFLSYYEERMVYLKKSGDKGATWSEGQLINEVSKNSYSVFPKVVCEDGTLYYAYISFSRNFTTMSYNMKKSYDDGEGWSDTKVILKYEIPDTELLEGMRYYLEAKRDTLVLTHNKITGYRQTKIISEVCYDEGETWDKSIELSKKNDLVFARATTFGEDGEDLHLIWYDYSDKKTYYEQLSIGNSDEESKLGKTLLITGIVILVLVPTIIFIFFADKIRGKKGRQRK